MRKTTKKLRLDRQVLRVLDAAYLGGVHGGVIKSNDTCSDACPIITINCPTNPTANCPSGISGCGCPSLGCPTTAC